MINVKRNQSWLQLRGMWGKRSDISQKDYVLEAGDADEYEGHDKAFRKRQTTYYKNPNFTVEKKIRA